MSQQRTIVITGASKGIGAATARHLAELGAQVVLAARSASVIEQLAGELRAEGYTAQAIRCDVSDPADVSALIDQTLGEFGAIDVLVNNAGTIEPIAALGESDVAAWGAAVDTNLKGVYYGLRFALPKMQPGGIVINVSSGAATGALEGWSSYCSTKAAVLSLTRCAHKEYGGQGIRVVGMSPGTVATDMQATIRDSGVNPVSQKDWSEHIPPEYAAKAIAFLCTDGGAAFAGQDFSIKTNEGRALAGLPLIN